MMEKEEYEEAKAKAKYLNSLQKEEYKEFLEIMQKWAGYTNTINRKEDCYISLWAINSFIEDFESKVNKTTGERKTNAENHLKTLYDIQTQYGKFYFESIAYRQKLQELQSDAFKMSRRISELEKENVKLNKMNEF
jgi:hypothetical protein